MLYQKKAFFDTIILGAIMFQKKIIEKYLSKIDRVLLAEKYTQFISIFADKQKQENIRASKEEQYQEGFIRDLFCAVLGYT
ncbi:MAG: hypothetical protein II610_05865, partial [Treponema sp.]|nr:hypothetical protein [Treponema sp.]